MSPEFIIKNLSPHARTFIITLEDMSHPIKRFTHWVIWNIPATDKIAKAIPSGKTISSPEGAVQGIGYGFHRYAGFAGFKKHVGLYPGPEAVQGFSERLKEYKTSKGTIQIPHSRPVPVELISDIARWCYETGNHP